jgi:hypothetical protein
VARVTGTIDAAKGDVAFGPHEHRALAPNRVHLFEVARADEIAAVTNPICGNSNAAERLGGRTS